MTIQRISPSRVLCAAVVLASLCFARAESTVTVDHNPGDSATASFKFARVPAPSKNDAASEAVFTLVDGARDPNGGSLERLHDGRVSNEEDQPGANFFFRQGDGGRVLVDLGKVTSVKQVNSYSWHADVRGPQVYELYGRRAASGTNVACGTRSAEFGKKTADGPESCGWTLLGKVDTRPKDGSMGGQYGVSITDAAGVLGEFRYLLFDFRQTESKSPFGNTFYSEIDIIDANGPAPLPVTETKTIARTFESGGKYQLVLDTTLAPDLTQWAEGVLAPVLQEWYPKLVEMLPSEGFTAPQRVTITFKDDMGGVPAAASGSRVGCNIQWFRKNLKGEAVGSVIHELVHVIQQYGRSRRGGSRAPGWLTEGIPDYVRWYKYEPQTRGAEISRRNLDRARYDASYRVSANFLNWATQKYATNLVLKLNAALREGSYSEELWKTMTGHTVQELGDEWKKGLAERL